MKQFADVIALVFVTSRVLSIGLNLTVSQIVAPLRRARLVVLSLVANFVVVPAAAGAPQGFDADRISYLTGEPFEFWGWVCGMLPARAHARSGDIARIAGYIGKSDAFATALSEFAEAYGDQTERDHAALVNAVRTGRVVANPSTTEGTEP